MAGSWVAMRHLVRPRDGHTERTWHRHPLADRPGAVLGVLADLASMVSGGLIGALRH